MTAAPAPWLRRGAAPGEWLTLTLDKGGERWTLDGRPLHAGDEVEVLLRGEGRMCSTCDGEGKLDGNEHPECPDCEGDGDLYRPAWCPARFEFQNHFDGTGHALLFLPLWHGAHADRLALRVEQGDRVRCRWPAPGAPLPADTSDS